MEAIVVLLFADIYMQWPPRHPVCFRAHDSLSGQIVVNKVSKVSNVSKVSAREMVMSRMQASTPHERDDAVFTNRLLIRC